MHSVFFNLEKHPLTAVGESVRFRILAPNSLQAMSWRGQAAWHLSAADFWLACRSLTIWFSSKSGI